MPAKLTDLAAERARALLAAERQRTSESSQDTLLLKAIAALINQMREADVRQAIDRMASVNAGSLSILVDELAKQRRPRKYRATIVERDNAGDIKTMEFEEF